jgi:hypothetical protein
MARVLGRRSRRERPSAFVLVVPAISFLIITVCPMAFAQAESCSKPRVAVQLTEIHDEVFGLLNSKSVPQPRESWIRQIQAKVVEELRMGSPDTEFVQVEGVGAALPTDCDYRFQYLLTLIGAGEDIEVAGLLHSEYTAYYMQSKLAQNNPCGGSDWLLDVEITKEDEDVFVTIEHNVEAWGDIGRRIEEYEDSQPVPPRGPKLHHSSSREDVSPLDGERSLDIKIDVTNCRGEPVYNDNPGQRVVLPKNTDRGEIEPTRSFPYQNLLVTGSHVILIIVRPQGAKATYNLKRGMEPKVETVEMTTCGIDAKLVEETEIHIHGIEIEVLPEKTVVCEGDSTPVEVKLSKVDTEGNKEPIAGQIVNVEVSGLIDGDVSPTGEVVTDEDGTAVLTYRAGGQDSSVTFKAKFQPPDYPDSARDSAVVTTCKGDLVADITASIEWERKGDSPSSYDVTGRSEFSIHGQMLIESGGGTAVITRYVPSDLELVTSYEEQWNRVSPDDGCPALYTRVQGENTQTLAADGLNTMAVYHQAGPMSGTYEVMLLGIPPTEVHGKKQRSSSCGQPDCLCRRYKPYERQVTIGRVGLRFPTGADGQMTGSRSWESHRCATIKDMVGFSVNEAFGMVQFDPSTEGGDEDCTVRVTASWSFRPTGGRQP